MSGRQVYKPSDVERPPQSVVSMKGIVILSLCAVYTLALFSCVALVKALAVLVMGQPLTIKAIDFKKKQEKLDRFDSNFNYFDEDSCSRCKLLVDQN